jgi:hypothetical protein
MANRNFPNNKLYQFETMPVLLSCNFVVDSTNGNGFGVRSLKGSGISRVYMNTSATPAVGSPNPAAGYILVQLTDTYSKYLSGFSGQVSGITGSSTATTAHVPNIILSLGTATLAQWQAAGLPKGAVPSVGYAFIPSSASTIGGGATVGLNSPSGIDHIEVCGDPNQSVISPIPLPATAPAGPQVGGEMALVCLLNSTPTAPANGSVVSLSFYLSNSSIVLAGQ